jgi:hypothetical protein
MDGGDLGRVAAQQVLRLGGQRGRQSSSARSGAKDSSVGLEQSSSITRALRPRTPRSALRAGVANPDGLTSRTLRAPASPAAAPASRRATVSLAWALGRA